LCIILLDVLFASIVVLIIVVIIIVVLPIIFLTIIIPFIIVIVLVLILVVIIVTLVILIGIIINFWLLFIWGIKAWWFIVDNWCCLHYLLLLRFSRLVEVKHIVHWRCLHSCWFLIHTKGKTIIILDNRSEWIWILHIHYL